MSEPVIRCEGVERHFAQGRARLEVLRGVDLAVGAGEQVAIVGASGVGKSTLLQIMGGLDDPSAGTVAVAGHDLAGASEQVRGRIRNRHLGFIYQFHHLLPEFSAVENVLIPQIIAGRARRDARRRRGVGPGDMGAAAALRAQIADAGGDGREVMQGLAEGVQAQGLNVVFDVGVFELLGTAGEQAKL